MTRGCILIKTGQGYSVVICQNGDAYPPGLGMCLFALLKHRGFEQVAKELPYFERFIHYWEKINIDEKDRKLLTPDNYKRLITMRMRDCICESPKFADENKNVNESYAHNLEVLHNYFAEWVYIIDCVKKELVMLSCYDTEEEETFTHLATITDFEGDIERKWLEELEEKSDEKGLPSCAEQYGLPVWKRNERSA